MRPVCLDFQLQRAAERAARGLIQLQPRTIPAVQGTPNALAAQSVRVHAQEEPGNAAAFAGQAAAAVIAVL